MQIYLSDKPLEVELPGQRMDEFFILRYKQTGTVYQLQWLQKFKNIPYIHQHVFLLFYLWQSDK